MKTYSKKSPSLRFACVVLSHCNNSLMMVFVRRIWCVSLLKCVQLHRRSSLNRNRLSLPVRNYGPEVYWIKYCFINCLSNMHAILYNVRYGETLKLGPLLNHPYRHEEWIMKNSMLQIPRFTLFISLFWLTLDSLPPFIIGNHERLL